MTLDGFLTFIALLVAILAIASPVARLQVRMRWPRLAAISLFGSIAVIYFEFFPLLAQPCPDAFGAFCSYLTIRDVGTLSAGQAAFLVVVLWALVAILVFFDRKMRAGALPALSALVSELAYERRFSELTQLVRPHLLMIDAAASRRLLRQRIFDKLSEIDPRRRSHESWLSILKKEEKRKRNWATRLPQPLAVGLSLARHLLPGTQKLEESASSIFRELMQSEAMSAFVAKYRPEFGIDLLRCKAGRHTDFSKTYFTALISDRASLLYREVGQNLTMGRVAYEIPSHNRLLYFLFNNAEVANDLSVWKPIGDDIVDILKPGTEYAEYLNGAGEKFEKERWRDPTFIAIEFFDVMVRAAIDQQIHWHMWLYYFPPFLKGLLSLYDASGPNIDASAEFPTRASRLIYELFETLWSWIEIVNDLPEDSFHLKIEGTASGNQNENIPKSAIIALGSALGDFVVARNISEKFRVYIVENVMRDVSRLRQDGVVGSFRQTAIRSILNRGTMGRETDYGFALKDCYDQIDHAVTWELKDFEAEFERVYGL